MKDQIDCQPVTPPAFPGKKIWRLPRRFFQIARETGFRSAWGALKDYLVRIIENLRYYLIIRYYRLRGSNQVCKTIHGSRMWLSLDDRGLSRQLLLYGTREKIQTALVMKILKPGMNVLEIGANLGYYTLIAASRVGPSGRVFAMEPVSANFDLLSRNIALNHLQDRIQVVRCAASSRSGQAAIAVMPESNWATLLLEHPHLLANTKQNSLSRTRRFEKVTTLTVDEFIQDKPPLDFIRMDVEGYEVEIIKGMTATLGALRSGSWIFMETHTAMFQPRCFIEETLLRPLADQGLEVVYIVDSMSRRLLDFNGGRAFDVILAESQWCPGVFWRKI